MLLHAGLLARFRFAVDRARSEGGVLGRSCARSFGLEALRKSFRSRSRPAATRPKAASALSGRVSSASTRANPSSTRRRVSRRGILLHPQRLVAGLELSGELGDPVGYRFQFLLKLLAARALMRHDESVLARVYASSYGA